MITLVCCVAAHTAGCRPVVPSFLLWGQRVVEMPAAQHALGFAAFVAQRRKNYPLIIFERF